MPRRWPLRATCWRRSSRSSKRWDPGERRRTARGSISAACRRRRSTITNQMLGEGEVSIQIVGRARVPDPGERVHRPLARVRARRRRPARRRLARGRPLPGSCAPTARDAGAADAAAGRHARRRDELAGAAGRDRAARCATRVARRCRARDQPDAVPDDARGSRGARAGAAGRAGRDDLARLRQLPRHVDAARATSGASSTSTT